MQHSFAAPGTYLWCYPDSVAPDSTARDFAAVGLADDDGSFRISGLHPGRYRVWAFADLNRNRKYDAPPADHAWRRTLNPTGGDASLTFTHDTNWTDIEFPPRS